MEETLDYARTFADVMRDVQTFMRGDLGQMLAFLVAGLLFFVVVGQLFKRSKMSLRAMTYAGLLMAVAFILSYLTLFSMPFGGSVTPISMFFVTLIGFFFGPAIGLVSALSYGLLQLVQRPTIVHPIQLLLDYPLAFGALGVSGFFWKAKNGLYIGFLVAVTARWLMHTISGVWFFGQFAPEGWNPLPYSMAYNASYIVAEAIITSIIIAIPAVRHAIYKVRLGIHN